MSFFDGLPRRTLFIRSQEVKLFQRYLLPGVAVIIALETNWLVAPFVSFLPPFLTFLAAIMVTAWYGRFLSAVFATLLSAIVINFYFIPPLNSFHMKVADWGTLGFFMLEAMIMAYCIDSLRKNEQQLQRANVDLELQVSKTHQQLSEKEKNLQSLLSQLAVTEERERRQLAAELHDYLAQLLILARMKAKQAEQAVYRSSEDANRYIHETDDLLRKSIEYVRTLMAELYPKQLHELGLPATLRWLADQMAKHSLDVELSLESESLPLTTEKALLVYQSVRELLMNIVKHAGVSRAFLSLEIDSEWVTITVQDQGRGFDTSRESVTVPGHHFGLDNVRERITTTGGMVVVKSSPGRGTTVTLKVPLEPSSESKVFRAAHAFKSDQVKGKPAGPEDQQSLTL